MKKESFVFGLVSLFTILSSGFVSAYYFSGARDISQKVVDIYIGMFEPVLNALFGGYWGGSGFYLFERFLLFIMLVVIINLVLEKVDLFKGQKAVKWIIAVIVPLIGIRYLRYEWLVSILVQYEAIVIILTSILPFIIYFYFLYEAAGDHGIIRKIGWILFIGIYSGLWSTATSSSVADIYLWTMIAAFICLFGDNIISQRLRQIKAMKGDNTFAAREVAKLKTKIIETQDFVRNGVMDNKTGEKIISDLRRQIKFISKY
jgi:hypothetical protein